MKDVILLHGALGSKEDLSQIETQLLNAGFRTHGFDFSGHGKAPFSKTFGIGQFSLELRSFITEKSLDKPFVFGYSMGGYVALYLETQSKGMLGKVITLATKFKWDPQSVQRESGSCNETFLREKAATFLADLNSKHRHCSMLLEKTAEMIKHFGSHLPLNSELLGELDLPVLLMSGELDRLVPPSETKTIGSEIKNSEVVILRETKHPLNSVAPSALAERIIAFIQK